MKKSSKSQSRSEEGRSSFATFCDLLPYMWERGRPDLQKRILWALFYLCLAKIILALVPYFFKFATNSLAEKEQEGAFFFSELFVPIALVLAYNIARILQAAFNQLRDAIFAKVGQHSVRRLAYETFVHTHQLSLRFHLQKKMGALFAVIERGTKGIDAIIRYTILNSFPTVLEFALACFVFWFSYGAIYLVILLAIIIAYIWFTLAASNWRIALRKEMNKYDTEANARALDSFSNFETVKYFCNEGQEAQRYDASMAKYEDAATKVWVSLGWLNFGQMAILGVGMTVLMVMSAYEVIRGTQTLGDFVFINALLIQISFPLNFIGSIYREIKQGLADIESMFQLLNVLVEITDKKDAPPLAIKKGEIEFDNVCFAYDERRPILKNVSFKVPAGKRVALVGTSGAGKSTIARLLFRFYDMSSGAIYIDGQNIAEVSQNSLRAVVGIVPQDTVLFNDTIFYNIHYGRLDASPEEVEEAAQCAQIAGFIESLPDKYDSLVGERGLKLSGGEKQRIAIARAILKKPAILLLDEATSALDSQTEEEIQSALNMVSEGRTSLVIAHRLSTIINADEILVLHQGEIVERGNHGALLAQDGLYARMWRRQKETKEAEERLDRLKKAEDVATLSES